MPQFVSKHRNLRLTRRPHVEVATPTGAFRTVERPVRYSFAPEGVLNVEEGQDLLADGAPVIDPETRGVKRDSGGFPVFEPQDAVEWLRSRPEYNNPEMVGGFTEVGREPDHIPDAGPRVREIIAAMAQLDVEALTAFARDEDEASYERPAVRAALEEAFEQVRQAEDAMTGAEGAGTAGNGVDDLEGLDMAALREAGEPLGLKFPPGTSKAGARALIREAREKVPA